MGKRRTAHPESCSLIGSAHSLADPQAQTADRKAARWPRPAGCRSARPPQTRAPCQKKPRPVPGEAAAAGCSGRGQAGRNASRRPTRAQRTGWRSARIPCRLQKEHASQSSGPALAKNSGGPSGSRGPGETPWNSCRCPTPSLPRRGSSTRRRPPALGSWGSSQTVWGSSWRSRADGNPQVPRLCCTCTKHGRKGAAGTMTRPTR